MESPIKTINGYGAAQESPADVSVARVADALAKESSVAQPRAIYLAGSWVERRNIRAWAAWLAAHRADKVTVVSTWHDTKSSESKLTHTEAHAISYRDLRDLDKADELVLFMGRLTTPGKYFEFGYAIAKAKTVTLVQYTDEAIAEVPSRTYHPPHEACVFTTLADHCGSWMDYLARL